MNADAIDLLLVNQESTWTNKSRVRMRALVSR
jgi:hypothetical protein